MKRYSEEEKVMWVEDWKESGMSLAAYARANELNSQSLRNWTNVETGGRGFVEVVPAAERIITGIPEILIEKGGIKIHLPIAINRNELRMVIQSLGCEA